MKSIGSDRVFFKGNGIHIKSNVKMSEWKVTRYRKTVVVFEEEKYQLQNIIKEDESYTYILSPLPSNSSAIPANIIEYNESYVKQRDETLEQFEKDSKIRLLLLSLYPFLGFLYHKTKLNLHERYGFHPGHITRVSLFLEWIAGLMMLAVIAIATLAGGLSNIYTGGSSGSSIVSSLIYTFLAVATVILFVDAGARFRHYKSDSMNQYGFFEWLIRHLDF